MFWKIIRIINYGEVLIPSGLVYEVFKKIEEIKNYQINRKKNNNNKKSQKSNNVCNNNNKKILLREVFNQFLMMNRANDRVENFRELRNYVTLEEIT